MLMEMLDTLTDDELAMLGCLLAFAAAGTVMSLSYYIGRAVRGASVPEGTARTSVRTTLRAVPVRSVRDTYNEGETLPGPSAGRCADEIDDEQDRDQQTRKAAA